MKIQINDERINGYEEVNENDVKVSIIEAQETTIKTLDDQGEVVEVTLNVASNPITTSLQDIDRRIQESESHKATLEKTLVNITAELSKLQTMRTSISTTVVNAMATRPVKPVEVVKEKAPVAPVIEEVLK